MNKNDYLLITLKLI